MICLLFRMRFWHRFQVQREYQNPLKIRQVPHKFKVISESLLGTHFLSWCPTSHSTLASFDNCQTYSIRLSFNRLTIVNSLPRWPIEKTSAYYSHPHSSTTHHPSAESPDNQVVTPRMKGDRGQAVTQKQPRYLFGSEAMIAVWLSVYKEPTELVGPLFD